MNTLLNILGLPGAAFSVLILSLLVVFYMMENAAWLDRFVVGLIPMKRASVKCPKQRKDMLK